jgi:hypothetical protein
MLLNTTFTCCLDEIEARRHGAGRRAELRGREMLAGKRLCGSVELLRECGPPWRCAPEAEVAAPGARGKRPCAGDSGGRAARWSHWRSYVYAWVFIGIPKILAKKN